MPTKKIDKIPKTSICYDPEHNPPTMMLFQPGHYEHTCPSCKKKIYFYVSGCEI